MASLKYVISASECMKRYVRRVLFRLYDLSVKLLRLRSEHYEENAKQIVLFYITTFTTFVLIIPLGFNVSDFPFKNPQKGEVVLWVLDILPLLISFVLLVIAEIVFLIFKNYSLYVLSVAFVWFCMCSTSHFIDYLGVWSRSVVLTSVFVSYGLTAFFGKNRSYMVIDIGFILLGVIVFVVSLLKDMILVTGEDLLISFIDFSDEESNNIVSSTFQRYFTNAVPIGILLLLVIIYDWTVRKWEMTIDSIGEAVLNLDFSQKNIQVLMAKNWQYSTRIERLLIDLVKNLEIYQTFLPDDIKAAEVYDSRSDSRSFRVISDTRSSSSGSSSGSFLLNDRTETTRSISYNIDNKEVVFLEIRIASFADVCEKLGASELSKIHRDYINTVSLVRKANGILSSVNENGRVLCTFNGVKRCVENGIAAVECALKIRDIFKKIYPEITLRMNIIKNKTDAGYLKIDDMTKYFMVSEKCLYLPEFDRLNIENFGNSIIVDDLIHSEAKFKFYFKQVGIIRYGKKGKNMMLFKLLGADVVGKPDEWMYELGEKLENDDIDPYQKCWNALANGNFRVAGKELDEYRKQLAEKDSHDDDIRLIEEMIMDKKAFLEI